MNWNKLVWSAVVGGAASVGAVALPAAPLRLVTGIDEDSPPHVKAFDEPLSTTASFFAYDPAFTGGVRVAAGDLDGDGWGDIITGTGPGAAHVKAFSGQSGAELRSFLAFSGFTGGVYVGSGDVSHDGTPDIVVGAGSGSPHVKVFDGSSGAEVRSFLAFGAAFAGGVRVASGDINGDGFAEIVAGTGPGGGQIRTFDGASGVELASFLPFAGFTGGVFVGAGDVNRDGFADLIAGTDTGAGQVSVFDGVTGLALYSFLPFTGFSGGVRVASTDLNGDGFADIVTGAGPGGSPHVKVFSGTDLSELASFLAYGPGVDDGVFVAGPSPVPEPGGWLLMASALAGILVLGGGHRPRSKRSSNPPQSRSHGCHA